MNHCPQCGASVDSDEVSCRGCGSPLAPDSSPSPDASFGTPPSFSEGAGTAGAGFGAPPPYPPGSSPLQVATRPLVLPIRPPAIPPRVGTHLQVRPIRRARTPRPATRLPATRPLVRSTTTPHLAATRLPVGLTLLAVTGPPRGTRRLEGWQAGANAPWDI